jgi:hypothetical protein
MLAAFTVADPLRTWFFAAAACCGLACIVAFMRRSTKGDAAGVPRSIEKGVTAGRVDQSAIALAQSGSTVNQTYIHTATFGTPQASARLERSSPDMSLKAAVTKLLGSPHWFNGEAVQAERVMDLLEMLPREAALSNITIWGRRSLGSGHTLFNIHNNLEPIPSGYWTTHMIDEIQFLENQESRSRGTLYETHDAFIDLHLSSRHLENIGSVPLSPLDIIFDPTNPGRKFWSHESPRDPSGLQLPGVIWEYRVLIRNTSTTQTAKNVSATVEGFGALSRRPEHALFDIGQTTATDLQPGAERLIVVLRWPYPAIQAGMAVGEGAYGPLKITVTADDIPAKSRLFRFDYQRTPMIYD